MIDPKKLAELDQAIAQMSDTLPTDGERCQGRRGMTETCETACRFFVLGQDE